ncbi:MAG: energy-coupling factor transporter transmembrane protein EcfT [Oscillospiraceae bacterium]|nr:energy-coupling factor transporter transmembrane protein EcfT [Oscillospiraceae bacterium]
MKYYPGTSFLHRLDARVKIILLLMLTILVFMTRNFPVLAVIFVFLLLGWKISGIPMRELGGYLKLLVGLIAFVVLIQCLFQRGETSLIDPILPEFLPLVGGMGRITVEGVQFGLLLGFRLLVIMCLMPLVIMCTRIRELSLGFVKLGVPYRIAFMITTALNQVPLLQDEITTITDAQKLRAFTVFEDGTPLKKLKAYPTLVIPLVMGAMKKSMLIGTAMDVRAFGSRKGRSYLHDIQMGRADMVTLVGMILFCAVLAAANYMLQR